MDYIPQFDPDDFIGVLINIAIFAFAIMTLAILISP